MSSARICWPADEVSDDVHATLQQHGVDALLEQTTRDRSITAVQIGDEAIIARTRPAQDRPGARWRRIPWAASAAILQHRVHEATEALAAYRAPAVAVAATSVRASVAVRADPPDAALREQLHRALEPLAAGTPHLAPFPLATTAAEREHEPPDPALDPARHPTASQDAALTWQQHLPAGGGRQEMTDWIAVLEQTAHPQRRWLLWTGCRLLARMLLASVPTADEDRAHAAAQQALAHLHASPIDSLAIDLSRADTPTVARDFVRRTQT